MDAYERQVLECVLETKNNDNEQQHGTISCGSGLGWSNDKSTSLGMGANFVLSDSARGNDMTTNKINPLLRLKFIPH